MGGKIDRKFFYDNFPSGKLFGKKMSPSRQQGFDAIFDAWEQMAPDGNLDWLAYGLATAWHETGGTMQPVREGFKATDAEACDHVTAYCKKAGVANYAAREPNGKSYYGRGYVQLTHADNYKKCGQRLGFGSTLHDDPDKVMEPKVAAQIMLDGMIHGVFRPKFGKVADYFNGAGRRWVDARDLINGDKKKVPNWTGGKSLGALIGGYGQAFRGALRTA